MTAFPELWVVFRLIPDEPPIVRSIHASAHLAQQAADLDDYRVRDLEGYEGCSHVFARYLPADEVGR